MQHKSAMKLPGEIAAGSESSLEKMYTVAQVANHLQCSEWHVRKAARDGDLSGFKVGKEWRFSRDQILAYLSGESVTLERAQALAESQKLDDIERDIVRSVQDAEFSMLPTARSIRRGGWKSNA